MSPACRGSNDAIPPGAAVVRVGCSRQSADPLATSARKGLLSVNGSAFWNHPGALGSARGRFGPCFSPVVVVRRAVIVVPACMWPCFSPGVVVRRDQVADI